MRNRLSARRFVLAAAIGLAAVADAQQAPAGPGPAQLIWWGVKPTVDSAQQPLSALAPDPKALMLAASKLNNLAAPGVKPWHIKASFQLFDEQGAVADEGTYEEFWAGPMKFKRAFTGKAFTQTDYGSDKGVLRSGSRDDVSPLLLDLRRDLAFPLPMDQVIEHESFSVKSIYANGAKLSCISVTAVAAAPPPGLTYCLSVDEPILRISAYSGQNMQILHNRILRLGAHTTAGDLKILRANKPVLTARVETFEALDTASEIDFAPTPDAVLLPRRISISAGVAVGMLEPHSAPIYPPEAKAAGISGTVVMETTIGVDGLVHDLRVTQGPTELQQAAMDAVRMWRYRPYLLNGSPVEVRTIVNVIFTLSK